MYSSQLCILGIGDVGLLLLSRCILERIDRLFTKML